MITINRHAFSHPSSIQQPLSNYGMKPLFLTSQFLGLQLSSNTFVPKSSYTMSKKPFHQRNGSGELHVYEATRARYFEDPNATLSRKEYMKEGAGRLSLDIPNNRRNSIPLHAMMRENRSSVPLGAMMMDTPMIKNEKKHKQPSSPGGKLAHFLNSLFNQTSSKKLKSRSKSTTSTQSMKDEDESPSSWRRKRRSSISLFRSGNSHSNTTNTAIASDTTSTYSRTLPEVPTKNPSEMTKTPINEHHKKNENLKIKSGFPEKKGSYGNGLSEKSRVFDVKHDDHHQKYDPTVEIISEFKRFILDEDGGGDSDSSSDLFELRNCDLGYSSSGLPVFETTHMENIKRGTTAPVSG